MAGAQLSVRAPSGRVVDITAGTTEKVQGVNTSFMLTTGKISRVFMIGNRGYHDVATEHVVLATLAWRAYIGGRELVASVSDDGQVLIATLIGRYHELMTVFADGTPNRKLVEATFASLNVEDTVEGMVVKANGASFATYVWEDVTVIVEGRGMLHIPDAFGAAGITPEWSGAKTSKGEIWKRELPEGGGHSYILGCPRGTADIRLDSGAATSEPDLLNWLDHLEVAWR